MRLTWTQPEDLVAHELVQSRAEGVDVAAVARVWQEAGGSLAPHVSGASTTPAPPTLRALAGDLLDRLDRLAADHRAAGPAAGTGDEPDDLEDIAAWWPDAQQSAPAAVDPDRMLGAWQGRCAGCLLGKPVEKLPRRGIQAIGTATGNWPVRQYFTGRGLPAEVAARWPWNRRSRVTSLAENIDGMPEDDDLNFSMLALAMLEAHGAALTTANVAQAWLDNLPAGRIFTAERVAYRNLLMAVPPEAAALPRNPFREWIGALIRADVYGWTNPGQPQRAARLAFADARLSHRRNGSYGALWVAAMCATALVARDADAVVTTGLSVVPPGSRLAAAVEFGVKLGRCADTIDQALDRLADRYGHLHWVHVLNNAALIAYALTASRGDFTDAVGLAVMAGWDTDSAAATVGGICGALAGARAVPAQWTAPLRNRVATSLPGFDGIALDELARRTLIAAGSDRRAAS